MNTKEIVLLAANYADAKKAENIKVIDLNGLSSLCDYIIIANATSKPHLDAIEEEISTQLKQVGVYKSNRDGGDSSQWRVSDYGSFLVHIMTPETRDFYALDKIFSFGTEIDFLKPAPKAAKKPAAKKAPAKKAATKKTVAKKPAVKKAPAKKATVKKPAVKKTVAKKPAAKKAPAKKAAPKKAAAKKTVSKTSKKAN